MYLRVNGENAAQKAEEIFGKITAIQDVKRCAILTEAMTLSEFREKCDKLAAQGVEILSTIRIGEL